MEQKITVEWQRDLELGELARLVAGILTEPRSFGEIRSYLSGRLKERDGDLPSVKIRDYRVSPRSLGEALASLESAGLIRSARARSPAGGETERLWSLTGG
jgi:DNA-binding transcriptional ArsR family regulator